MSTLKVLEHVLEETDAGRRVALCVIVATHGSTPQPAGTMVCVDEAATMTGTLGGGCVEADIRHNAHRALSAGTCELTTFALDGDFGHDDGMICGGRMDVAIAVVSPSDDAQPYRTALADLRAGRAARLDLRIVTGTDPMLYRVRFAATPRLLIAGAGHISRRLARIAMPLGFEIHVIDDRAQYANATRFPPPIRTHVGEIASTLSSGPLDQNTFVVIVTRGHKHDEAALSAVINSPVKYIGMIGSRRKIKVIFDDLRHEGIDDELLDRVHAPIGLNIGAVTTEEIAVSIAAQLVSIRRADSRCVVEGPFPASDDSP